MEIFTRKGRGRPRKVVPDASDVAEGQGSADQSSGDGEAVGTGIGTQENHRKPNARTMAAMRAVLTGSSVVFKR